MTVTITSGVAKKVSISCGRANVITVSPFIRKQVVISVLRSGNNGKTAYELWLELGNVGTPEDYQQWLRGDDAINNTLEDVRAADPKLGGNINADGNQIDNLGNAILGQQAATLTQVNAAKAEAIAYAATISLESVRWAGYWDASAGTYPNNSGIRRGDEYEASVAGLIGTIAIEVGDIFRARINNPGQSSTNWSIAQGNVQQATETRQGSLKVATPTTASDENSTNDVDALTSKKWWQNVWSRVLQLAWTWAAKQTFTASPRFSSMTTNSLMKVNGVKDLVPAVAGVDYLITQNLIDSLALISKNHFAITEPTSVKIPTASGVVIFQETILPNKTNYGSQFKLSMLATKVQKTGTASNVNFMLYMSTSNVFDGTAVFIGQTGASNGRWASLTRLFTVYSSNEIFGLNSGASNIPTDESSANTTPTLTPFTPTTAYTFFYVAVLVSPATTTDEVVGRHFVMERIK